MRALSSPILHPPPIPPSHITLHLPQQVRTPPCCSTLPQPTPGHTIYALQPRRIAAYLRNACPPLMQRLPSNLPMPMPMQKVAPNHHDSVRPTTPHATNNANPRTPAGRDKPPLRAVLLVRVFTYSACQIRPARQAQQLRLAQQAQQLQPQPVRPVRHLQPLQPVQQTQSIG